MTEHVQTVVLVTDSGERLVFHGRAQIDPDNPPKIHEIIATRWRQLPDGCKWEELNLETNQ